MSLQSRYTILRKIADGGTAEIFLAKQHGAHGFEKMVVLKRIFPAFYADPQFRHMLVDEAHVAMTLNHSNIVQVLDLGESDGRYSLALELVDGWTLDSVLKRAKAAAVPFPPALALYMTAEVCRALAYAHGKMRDGKPLGIVHRDISPHNVMLSAEGEVKLTDFGIATTHNKKEPSLKNLIKGKISFMSPEQASGGDLDARSDLFSVGTMLYAMITRRLPFDAPTDYETLMLVKSGDYLPPETARPGLNPELYRVIRKAMGKLPADRYQKAEEMLVDVEQVMRLAFRPVGQTELQRWLADLSAKDGVPPLTREAPGEPGQPPARAPAAPLPARLLAARPLAAQAEAQRPPKPPPNTVVVDGQESGLVLDIADAVEVSGAGPPPPPRAPAAPPPPPAAPPTEVMAEPAGFEWAEPWYRRRGVRMTGVVAAFLLLAALSAKALVRGGRRPEARDQAAKAEPTPPPVPPPPAANQPPPAPATSPPPTAPAAAVAPAAAPATAAAPAPAPAADGAAVAVAAKPEQPPAPEKLAENTPDKAAAKSPERVPENTAPAPKEEPAPEKETADEAADDAASSGARAAGRTEATARVSVSVKSDPEGTHVSTRHKSFGTTPLSLKLRPGNTYELNFSKPGYVPLSKKYTVGARPTQNVRVTLKKVPEPPKKVEPAPPPPAPPLKKKGFFSR